MTSEGDTPESFILQARDEENLDRTDRHCVKGTVHHPKEHTSFEDVLQTRGTNDHEQRKNNLEVGNGNNECTDGECFWYPPSVEKVAHDDMDGKSEDCAEGTSDDAKNAISKSNLQQNSNNVATEEGAEEQPAERAGLDAEGKENSDTVISVDQELESGQNNEEEERNIEKDNKGNSDISLEKKTEEIPLCVVDQQLEGFEIDAISESNAIDPKKCSESTHSGNSTVSPGILEATVSEAEDKKASTAVVKGPEIMPQTENKSTQKDEDENTESCGLADISTSHTSSSPIDSDKESISEIMKDMKELGISSSESIDAVEEKKGPHEIGKNNNLEEGSKSLFEKDFEDTTGSSTMLKNKTGAESNTENLEEDLETDKVDQNEEDSFLSKADSEITTEGALETATETPEECIVKAMMNQEGRVKENLNETLTLISGNTEAVETTEEITFSEQGDTKLGMENSEDERNQTDTIGAGNGDTARIFQDITSEAKLNETTNFQESITSQNEYDLCLGNNTVTTEKGDEKIGVCTEFQPKEQENHDIEISNEEKLDSGQASEVTKLGNSDEEIQSKGVDFITSMTKKEKISEVVDPEPEERQDMQNKEELTETETQRKASNSNLQETTIVGDAEEEISKDNITAVGISHETSAEIIKQSSFEVKEADISCEDKKQYIEQNDFKSEHPPTEKEKHESILSKEEHTDDITKNTPISIIDGSCQNDELENQTFEESSSGNGEGNQEIVEISPRQKEVTKIDNDRIQVIEFETTTDRHHEIQEDEDLYNINGVTADQDINADLDSIEVQKDEIKQEEIGFNEVNETESVTNEEIVNQSSGESDSCSGNQGQEIAEAYRQFIEVENLVPRNDECTRISNEEIQVLEVEEEVATDTQHYCRETRDPNKTTNGVSTCMVRGEEIEQRHDNSMNVVEDVNQDINVESDNTEEIQDEKSHKHTNCDQDLKTEVVQNEEIINQSSEERDASSRKQDQEDAQASAVDADIPTSSIDEYTSVSSTEVQVSDIEEEAVIIKHPCTSETQNLPEDRVEISLEKQNSKCLMKDMLQDTKTQSDHIEKEKDEKTNEKNFSNVIYEEVVNNEKIVSQNFEENDWCSGTRDEDIDAIAQASTPLEDVNIFPSYDECTRVASKEIQVSEIEEETDIKQQSTDTENPNEMTNGAMSCEVKGVEIVQENMNSMNKVKNVDQDINAKSESIEALTDEQTGSSEIHEIEEVINEEIVSLRSEESNSYSGKQDQEISQAFTPFKEDENLDLSKDDSTRIFREEIQVTEVEKEATTDQRHLFSETENAHMAKTSFCSQEVRGVKVSLEEEKLREDGNQDINAHSGRIEAQNNDKTNEKSCSNEIRETDEINNTDIVNQSVEESDTCSRKDDKYIAQASTPHLEAEDHVPSNDDCTRISNDAILVSKIEETAAIEEQQCCPENEHTNKATNGVFTYEVKRVEIIQDNQNSMNIEEAVNQDLNGDSDCIPVLQDEITHDEISFTDIYETEVVNNEEIVNHSSKKSDSSSGKEEQDFAQESIPIVEVRYSIASNDEHTSISNEEMENRELEGKATITKQHCSTRNENLMKIPSGLSCDEFTRVEIVQENENSMKILEVLEDVDQDINVESENIQVPQDENTHEQTRSNAIHETEEEIMNKTSDEEGSWGVKQYQESCETSIQLIEAEDLVPSKDECPGTSSEEDQVEEASIEKLQSRLETEESNKTGEGVHSDEVRGVETLPETANSLIIREDVNQDINVQLGSIEVQNNEKSYEKTCSNQIHETEPANNEDIENRSFKDSNSCNGKQDQEISPASTLHIETEDLISSNDKDTREDKEEASIAKQQFSAEDEDPNKIENGVSSIEVGGMEIAQGDENFIDIVEDVNQDVCIDSETIGAQRDARSHKVLYEIHDRKIDIHEAVNQSSEDQGITKASSALTKVEISNKDEGTNTTKDEIQVNEVEEEVAVEKKQCSTKTEDEYKITDGVCPFKVNEMETEQQNESYMNSVQDEDQDKNAELDSIEVQTDEETHKQTGSHMIHETKLVNNEEIVSQSTGRNQDQETVEASTPLIEAENLVVCKGDCTRISGEEIQVTAIEEEAADPDKTKTDVSSYKFRGVETDMEYSIVVEENQDQDINVQPDTIDLQKDERTLEQSSSNEIHESQLVNNEKIVNPRCEESVSYNGKQDQEIVNAFTPITENPTSSKYQCTRISSVKIQEDELEAAMETADENKIKNSFSCMVKGVEILQENESYMNKMDDVLQVEKDLKLSGDAQSNDKQCTEENFHHVTEGDMEDDKDINVESNNIEVQEDEKTHEQTCLKEIHIIETHNHVDIDNQSSEEGDSCGEKLNQESLRASTAVIEAQNLFSSKDECTRMISREDFQAIIEATIEKHQCSSEIEDPQELNNDDSSYENMEPVALQEMLTCCSESIELREVNNEGNDATNRSVEDQGANSTKNLFGNSWRETNNEEISQDEGTMEKVKDADQINKECPIIERKCKQDDSQEAIAQEKTYDEVKSTHVVQPEDERNMYDKQVPEGKETLEICKSSEIDGSLSFTENEATNQIQEKNFSDRIPNQQKPEGTESSGQNGRDEMGNLDQVQSPKMSYDQTQLIEFNEAAGFESEVHKHENEEPQDMSNSLEEEVKCANKSISRDEMDTASKKIMHEASIAEVSSVQNVISLKLGIPKESIGGDKQEVNSGKTEHILKNIMIEKEGTSSQEFGSAVETQETDSRKMLLPKVEGLDITSPKDTEESTNITELERKARDVSSRETSLNLRTENLELDDARGGITFPNQMAVLRNCQDVKETSTAASLISQANETDEQHQAPSSKHLEQVYETTKRVAEMEETTDSRSSEKPIQKPIQETCVPEIELRELEVPTLKDEPIEDSLPKQELAEIVQRIGEESEDLSLEFETTSSTSESKMSAEPLSYPASSSHAILNTSKVQDSKNIVEIPNVSPQFVSEKCFGPSNRVSTEFHEVIERSQQLPEPKCEETEKTRLPTNSSELITEGKSLTNFEAHEATIDELKCDKIAETESLDKEGKTIMGDEQETITERSNSSIDDGTNAKDNIQGLLEHKDFKKFSQIQNMRELVTPTIEEQEQELQEIHNQLPASSQFQDSCSDVLKEESIGDKLQLQADSKEEPEEHNQIKACAQKGITIIESKRNGVSPLPPNDHVKKTLERAADDSSSATDGNLEQTDRNPDKTQAHTIESEKYRVFSSAPNDTVINTLERAATDYSSNATDGNTEQTDKNLNKTQTHTVESDRNEVTSLPPNHPVKNITERAATIDTSIIKYRNSDRTDENPNKIQTHTVTSDTSYTPTKQQEIISEEITADKPKSDEEKNDETESKGPLISEELREMDLKTNQKKPHNILSGVGSKVKHSISKVKKAMTCSSSQFAPEDVIIKLNKNKKSTN